jgi:pimeloyl-ACP methyl ester carboxylesterase
VNPCPRRFLLPPPPGTVLAPVALTYRPAPAREAIVFLHGLGCSRNMWELIIEVADHIDVRARAYELVAMDFPGHGSSPNSPNRSGIIEALLHVERVLDAIEDVDRIHIVAHSMATAVLGYYEQYTKAWLRRHQVATVIAIEGNLTPQDCGIVSQQIADTPVEQYLDGGHDAIARALDESGGVTDRKWAEEWRRARPATVWSLAKDVASHSWKGELYWKSFGPRAYLRGQDSDIPAETLRLVADSPVFTVKGADHFPMILNPVGTLKAVLDAIDTLSHQPN